MYRRFRRNIDIKRVKRFRRMILFLLLIAVIIFIIIEYRIRPIMENIIENKSNRLATLSINNAITEIIENNNITYNELSTIQRNDEGEIIAIESNIAQINKLKSIITLAIQDNFDGVNEYEIEIPIGTLLGSEIFVGRGGNIKVYVSMSGTTLTDIVSTFESVGINQTKHSIIVNITASIDVTTPSYQDTINITTSIPLAETVIVGDVPNLYAQNAV